MLEASHTNSRSGDIAPAKENKDTSSKDKMAATLHSPLPSNPSNPSTPPTPSSAFPAALARLRETALERNASTSSSRSTQTTSSTSSLEPVPMRAPPMKTSTAATPQSQMPSRPSSAAGTSRPGVTPMADLHSLGYGAHAGQGYGSRGLESGQFASPADYHSPSAVYGGRNFQRNGPRMGGGRHATGMLPAIITSDAPLRSSSVPLPENTGQLGLSLSPTTPRQSRFYETNDSDQGSSLRPGPPGSVGGSPNLRGSIPASPIEMTKQRGLSVGQEKSRERRQSGNSTRSSAGARPRESPSDYVFGEELGRGSYSTVVQAVRAPPVNRSPTSPRPSSRQFAIKIINQAHLVQEKKTKYAMIERDALVRLNAPLSNTGPATPSHAKGHRRGMSGSSNGGAGPRKNQSSTSLHQPNQQSHSRRNSTVDRLSINTNLSDSTSSGGSNLGFSAPLSPTLMVHMTGRRPSRSADPPEMVPERSEDGHSEVLARSRPPSPVREDSREHVLDAATSGRPVVQTPPKEKEKDRQMSEATLTPNGHGDGRSTADAAEAAYEPPRTPVPASTARMNGGAEPRTPSMAAEPDSTRIALPKSPNIGEKREKRRSNEDTAKEAPVPRSRRASKAPSDRSSRSVGARSHPGIIRLFSTFNDATSLYFVLDLAANGELLGSLRKYGSLDTESARYYAAQLLDTVEFMHERGVVHRDLKPENILLDDDMRIKVTDFGSAKLLDADPGPEEGKKRSFVGSADFVSPEVLRNEPASAASDVWAFGCIVYQLFVGKPPFRGATDYLTFQKILKREMEYPAGFPDEAKDLIETILDLNATSRPTAADLKSHPFFSPIDWSSIWTIPAPPMSTGITKPVITLANIDPQSDMWAVFDDDVSDGGFGDDADLENSGLPHDASVAAPHADPNALNRRASRISLKGAHGNYQRQISSEDPHRWSPQYDHYAAAQAVQSVDLTDPSALGTRASGQGAAVDDGDGDDDLDPPRPGWMDSVRKKRGFSRGSARTSSSSSANRTALTGLLESMGIHTVGQAGSGRTSRNSMKSEETNPYSRPVSTAQSPNKGTRKASRSGSGTAAAGLERLRLALPHQSTVGDGQDAQLSSVLLANERVVFTSAVTVRTSALPSFLTPNATKRRQLVLTDFPRLFAIKDESTSSAAPAGSAAAESRDADRRSSVVVRNECILVPRPSAASVLSTSSAGAGTTAVDLRAGGTAGAVAGAAGGANRLIDVQEKGPKGFLVNTSSTYYAETTELRNEWIRMIRQCAE